MPLLWTGLCYGFMGIINPLLAAACELALVHRLPGGVRPGHVDRRDQFGKGPGPTGGERARAVGWFPGVRPGWRSAVNPRGISMRRPMPGCRRHWTLAGPARRLGGRLRSPRPAQSRRPVRAASRRERTFDALFRRNCAGCHGADGKLGPAPPLNDQLFLALIPDAELQRVIAEGRPGTLMPAFAAAKGGQLTAEQVDDPGRRHQAALGTGRAGPERSASVLCSPRPGPTVPRPGQGRRPQGVRPGLRLLPRRPRPGRQTTASRSGAINDPDFLALISDQALRRYVITGRPDLGMPDYADPTGRPEGFQPLTSAGRHEPRRSPGRLATRRVGPRGREIEPCRTPPARLHRRHRPIPGRRTFFQWLTYAMGAVAAAVVAIPFVGYLFGALRKHRVHWVGLGPPGQFPLNETRLATFEIRSASRGTAWPPTWASTSATWARTTSSRISSWSSP